MYLHNQYDTHVAWSNWGQRIFFVNCAFKKQIFGGLDF